MLLRGVFFTVLMVCASMEAAHGATERGKKSFGARSLERKVARAVRSVPIAYSSEVDPYGLVPTVVNVGDIVVWDQEGKQLRVEVQGCFEYNSSGDGVDIGVEGEVAGGVSAGGVSAGGVGAAKIGFLRVIKFRAQENKIQAISRVNGRPGCFERSISEADLRTFQVVTSVVSLKDFQSERRSGGSVEAGFPQFLAGIGLGGNRGIDIKSKGYSIGIRHCPYILGADSNSSEGTSQIYCGSSSEKWHFDEIMDASRVFPSIYLVTVGLGEPDELGVSKSIVAQKGEDVFLTAKNSGSNTSGISPNFSLHECGDSARIAVKNNRGDEIHSKNVEIGAGREVSLKISEWGGDRCALQIAVGDEGTEPKKIRIMVQEPSNPSIKGGISGKGGKGKNEPYPSEKKPKSKKNSQELVVGVTSGAKSGGKGGSYQLTVVSKPPLPDQSIEIKLSDANSVTKSVEVEKKFGLSSVEQVRLSLVGDDKNLTSKPKYVTVRIKGEVVGLKCNPEEVKELRPGQVNTFKCRKNPPDHH